MGKYIFTRHALGTIRYKLRVMGDKRDAKLEVLFDSGSSYSLINGDIVSRIATLVALHFPRELTVADGHVARATHSADLAVIVNGKRVKLIAYVIDELPVPMIFGALDMEAYRIKLDPRRRKLDLSEFTGNILAL